MPDAVSTLASTLTYSYAAWIAAIALVVVGVVFWMVFGLGRQNAQIKLALNNMAQGLCMWDARSAAASSAMSAMSRCSAWTRIS